MEHKLSRVELIELLDRISSGDGTEDELDAWVALFEKNVPHPEASGLIFWPERYGLGTSPSHEKIVDKALNYKPIQL
jgi:hypothetical protein